jgi:alkanesulfonate monooxygenase
MMQHSVKIFSTCPIPNGTDQRSYLQNVIDVAQWSERAGCRGILVYSDNSQVDPWLISQVILENTEHLCPLPAIQPVYMHPYAVAKAVTTLAYLYGRRLYLNMIAGGYTNDLLALNDLTPHDKRYARLIEYTTIIKELLASESPASYDGEFYKVDKLRLKPPLDPDLFPGIFVSGSSEAGLAAARTIGATAIKYPKPPGEETTVPNDGIDYGVRIGIITRETDDEAWRVAHERYPEDRKGQLTHQLAMKVSDSVWHKQLGGLDNGSESNPYWLVPFKNYKAFCPYLVGSYERVAEEVARYTEAGYKTFILDIPPTQEELSHIAFVFRHSLKQTAA